MEYKICLYEKLKNYFTQKFSQTNEKVPRSIVEDLTSGVPTKIDELFAEVEVDGIERKDYSDRFLN